MFKIEFCQLTSWDNIWNTNNVGILLSVYWMHIFKIKIHDQFKPLLSFRTVLCNLYSSTHIFQSDNQLTTFVRKKFDNHLQSSNNLHLSYTLEKRSYFILKLMRQSNSEVNLSLLNCYMKRRNHELFEIKYN